MTRLRRAAYLASVHTAITAVACVCWACRWAWDSHRALWRLVRRDA